MKLFQYLTTIDLIVPKFATVVKIGKTVFMVDKNKTSAYRLQALGSRVFKANIMTIISPSQRFVLIDLSAASICALSKNVKLE